MAQAEGPFQQLQLLELELTQARPQILSRRARALALVAGLRGADGRGSQRAHLNELQRRDHRARSRRVAVFATEVVRDDVVFLRAQLVQIERFGYVVAAGTPRRLDRGG